MGLQNLPECCKACSYIRPNYQVSRLEFKCSHPKCRCSDSILEHMLNTIPCWCPLRDGFNCEESNCSDFIKELNQ